MGQYWGFFRNALAALALIATLGVAVLPNGQLPRVAGPCGRALCNCPLEVVPQTASAWCPNCKLVKRAPRVLSLGASVVSTVDGPGLAFLSAIDAGVPLARVAIPFIIVDKTQPPAFGDAFALKIAAFDIPTPPPRA